MVGHNNNHNFKYLLIILLSLLFSINSTEAIMTNRIIIIGAKKNSGNNNQLMGLVNQLKDNKQIDLEIWQDGEDFLHRLDNISDKTKATFVAVHQEGLTKLGRIEDKLKNQASYILLTHEYLPQLDWQPAKLTKLYIPSYIEIDQKIIDSNHAKIIKTYGVASNLNEQIIEDDLAHWLAKFHQADSYISIILGGHPKGHDYEIAKDELDMLAKYIKNHTNGNIQVIVTSNPRTSKQSLAYFSDLISKNQNIHSVIIPFAANQESPYKALIGLTKQNSNNQILVSGESISMTYEIAQFVPNQLSIIMMPSIMENIHHKSAQLLYQDNRAKLLHLDTQIYQHNKLETNRPKFNTAKDISKQIIQDLELQQSTCYINQTFEHNR